MKQMHRLIVTSETYKLASEVDQAHGPTGAGAPPSVALESVAANQKLDPSDTYLWHFRLERLDAEPVWDSILTVAGNLDTTVGGPSFELPSAERQRRNMYRNRPRTDDRTNRRAAYMLRGYTTSGDVMPHFLKAFDADDGLPPAPFAPRR